MAVDESLFESLDDLDLDDDSEFDDLDINFGDDLDLDLDDDLDLDLDLPLNYFEELILKMGSGNSSFPAEELSEYEELTFLTKKEILQ